MGGIIDKITEFIKELLQGNWDFVARWFLGEYYEGE
jgi:hypothetical protein